MAPQPVKPRVLVVDDHPANRVAFQSLLEEDYTVKSASSGQQALEFISKEQFAVILLDVRMPVLDGFETATLIRNQEQTRYTPIIFTSAYDYSELRIKQGYVAGATDFILSPVDPDLLRFKVAAYAQLYLRNEALRIQVEQLNNVVQSLQVELSRRMPVEEILKSKIQELEAVNRELLRQVSGVTA